MALDPQLAAYKEQMKMLDYLIDLGLPFALLFPTEVNNDALRHW